MSRDAVRRWGFHAQSLRVIHTRLDGHPGENFVAFTNIWLQCATKGPGVFSFLFQDMPEIEVLIDTTSSILERCIPLREGRFNEIIVWIYRLKGEKASLSSMEIHGSTSVRLGHRQAMSLFAKERTRTIRSECMLGRTKTVAGLEQGRNQARISEYHRLCSPN